MVFHITQNTQAHISNYYHCNVGVSDLNLNDVIEVMEISRNDCFFSSYIGI